MWYVLNRELMTEKEKFVVWAVMDGFWSLRLPPLRTAGCTFTISYHIFLSDLFVNSIL